MSAQTPTLQAKTREKLGSRYCDRIRKTGGLPAIVYGKGRDPLAIVLDAREAVDHFHKGEKVFKLDFPGTNQKDEMQVVLLKEVQFDYLGTKIVHADLARVDLNERVRVRVPLHLVGESPAMKQAGAIMLHPTTEIEIECVVTELPEFIEVPITELDVGHAITAREVKLPSATMKLLTDPHAKVAQIVIQQEVVEAEATPAAAGAAEPEVITAKKKEEEGAAGDAKKGDAKAAGAKPAADKKK